MPTTAPQETVPELTGPHTWANAFSDLRAGFAARELWGHLGWNDVRDKYRRSLLGPFWMTVAMGLTTVGLGGVFSLLWHSPVATFVPYVGTGLIVWAFLSGCLLDGLQAFTASEELIRQAAAPLTVHVLRVVWRQTLNFAHNLIVYVVLVALFFPRLHESAYTMFGQPCGATKDVCHPGLGWNGLAAAPGFLLLVALGIASTLVLGVLGTRFRDAPPIVAALVQLLFILVPITWPLDTLIRNAPDKVWLIELNPLFHFVQIVRQPLVGQRLDWWSWAVAGGLTALAWVAALLILRRFRARVPYWI